MVIKSYGEQHTVLLCFSKTKQNFVDIAHFIPGEKFRKTIGRKVQTHDVNTK